MHYLKEYCTVGYFLSLEKIIYYPSFNLDPAEHQNNIHMFYYPFSSPLFQGQQYKTQLWQTIVDASMKHTEMFWHMDYTQF